MLRGEGRFVDDLRVPGLLHAVFVRSPHASALLKSVDTAAARAIDGVIAVLVGADLARVTMPSVNRLVQGLTLPRSQPIAGERIDYAGQPVALVVASSVRQARKAAALVEIDAQPCAVQLDPEAFDAAANATAGGGFSIAFDSTHKQAGAEASFKESASPPEQGDAARPIVVRCRLRQPRVAAVALEPRAILVEVDAPAATPASGSNAPALTVWMQSQSPARSRDDIAMALGLQASQVRVIAPDVGGAFGSKASVFPDDLLICAAALVLGAPLKWTATRSEEFLAGVHGRGATLEGTLSVAPDGRLLALDASLAFPLGAWLPFSATVPARNAARILPGPYRLGGAGSGTTVRVRARAQCANNAAVNIYRGAGRPEATILMEVLIDRAARRLRIDPVVFRLRHLLCAADLPWRTASGETLDSGDYQEALRAACDAFGYAAARGRQQLRRKAGERVGIGIACYVEPCGQGWESATVSAHAQGRFVVASGSSAQGQGHETVFAAVAAKALGCDPSSIDVLQADTASCPAGIGALASRSIAIGASAIDLACRQLAARLAAGDQPLPDRPVVEKLVYEPKGEAWSHGCVITQLSIDSETGRPRIESIVWVDDAGRIVNPVLAKGQLVGGLAQGLGQALFEGLSYDDTGQLLTGSLMDYALPRATDMPPVSIHDLSSPSPMNALGAKGVGEAGCIGVPAAILNAVHDALGRVDEVASVDDAASIEDVASIESADSLDDYAALDERVRFPLTPERLWRALGPEFQTRNPGA